MLRLLAAMALAVVTATAAFADTPPWQKPVPGMTQAHKQAAARIASVVKRSPNPLAVLGFNPLTTEWDWAGGARASQPMSNMTHSGMRKLFSGRYFVYMAPNSGGKISVDYFGTDGVVHQCYTEGSRLRKARRTWQTGPTQMGFAGILKLDRGRKAGWGWPVVYDPATGILADYDMNSRRKNTTWSPKLGHVQNEYAPVFAEFCPDLPRKAQTNQAQTSRDYNTFLRQAPQARVRNGGEVVFRSDPQNPLTAEMYYALYPPQQ